MTEGYRLVHNSAHLFTVRDHHYVYLDLYHPDRPSRNYYIPIHMHSTGAVVTSKVASYIAKELHIILS